MTKFSDRQAQLDRWKQELLDVKAGWEFAFANAGHGYGGERRSEFVAVLARVRNLEAKIQEFS